MLEGRILLVDDDETNRLILSKQLLKLGFEVIVAENGGLGIDLLRKEKVDLVLLDQMMPDMNGLETFETIKKNFFMDRPPVIMMTAQDSASLAVTFMKSGGADFITKPVDVKALLVKILEALKVGQLRKELRRKAEGK
jgi:DNA-binding response OmpR family regulator